MNAERVVRAPGTNLRRATRRSTLPLALPLAMTLACSSDASPGGDDTTGGASTSTTTETSTSTGFTTTSASTTFPATTTTTTSEDESSSGGLPDGYPCSVQVVTHGAIFDPLERGDSAGVFPPIVADALEDTCGCHTLSGGAQNLEWPKLGAPGGTNFVTYADLMRPFESGTLGQAIESEVRGFRMPVGSCPKPPEIMEILIPWFDQGQPDGATFVP